MSLTGGFKTEFSATYVIYRPLQKKTITLLWHSGWSCLVNKFIQGWGKTEFRPDHHRYQNIVISKINYFCDCRFIDGQSPVAPKQPWSFEGVLYNFCKENNQPEESSSPDLSNQRVLSDFECCTVPSLSPYLSVAPASCPGRAHCCGLCYQPSAAAGAHPQRWAMTETAGPQGGPPPSVGRGPWSEAFRRGGKRGRFAGLTRLSAQTHTDHKWNLNLNTRCNILSFRQNLYNESECGVHVGMKAARWVRINHWGFTIRRLPTSVI